MHTSKSKSMMHSDRKEYLLHTVNLNPDRARKLRLARYLYRTVLSCPTKAVIAFNSNWMTGIFLSTISLQAIGISLISILISGAIFYHYVILHNNPNEPPLVKGPIPFLGCALALKNDLKSFLFRNKAKHGDIFSFYVVGKRIHVISDPTDGIATYFRSKAFRFEEFALLVRRKQFLNTEEEMRDDSMTDGLAARFTPDLLSIEATKELIERMISHVPSHLENLIDPIGNEWKEIDLVDWCCRLVFRLSNIALIGPEFPSNDEQLFRDFLQLENQFIKTWKTPEIFLGKEKDFTRKLILKMQKVYDDGINPGQIVRNRIKVI